MQPRQRKHDTHTEREREREREIVYIATQLAQYTAISAVGAVSRRLSINLARPVHTRLRILHVQT